jgi:AcrR family transcriptional regulator
MPVKNKGTKKLNLRPARQRSAKQPVAPDDLSTYSRAKREQILRAAIKLFLAEGYAATSMNRVAEKANVTKQTIYSHFLDKESLFIAIIEEVTTRHMEDELGSAPLSGSPDIVLRSFASFILGRRKDEQYIALLRTVIAESRRFPELSQLYVKTVIKKAIKTLSKYFESRRELKIEDAEATSRIFCGSLISYIISQEILHGKDVIPLEANRLVDTLVSQILRC